MAVDTKKVTKVKILETTKTDGQFLLDSDLRRLLEPKIGEYKIVDSIIRLSKHSQYDTLYKNGLINIERGGSISLVIRDLLLIDNIIPIVMYSSSANELKKLESQLSFLKVRAPKGIYAITISGAIIKVPYDTLIYVVGLAVSTSRHPIESFMNILDIGKYSFADHTSNLPIKALLDDRFTSNFLPVGITHTNNKVANKLEKNDIHMYYFEDLDNTNKIKETLNKFIVQVNVSLKYLLYNSDIYSYSTLNLGDEYLFELPQAKYTPEYVKKDYPKLFNILDKLASNGIISTNYESTLGSFMYLNKLNLLDTFIDYISNDNNKIVDFKISQLLNSIEHTNESNHQNVLNIKKQLLCKTYENIIESKFGNKRFLELKDTIAQGQPELIYNALSSQEKKIVDVTIKMENDFYQKYTTNKCPHVTVYNKLFRSRSLTERDSVLKELETFMAKGKNMESRKTHPEMITCKLCKLNIICPHVIERLHLERESYDTIRNALTKYATEKMSRDSMYVVFCQVCGGYLSKTIAPEINIGNFSDDILQQYITYIRAETYNFSGSLTFETFLNANGLVNLVVRYISPFINDIDKDILKWSNKKIKVTEEMKIKIYIAIMTYSLILYLLVNEQFIDHVHIRGKKIIGPRRHKEYSSFIFSKLMNAIGRLFGDTKTQIMNSEFVLKKFNDYFMIINNFTKTRKIVFSQANMSKIELIKHITTLDPVYNYTRMMYLMYNSTNKRPLIGVRLTSNELKSEFETILGKTTLSKKGTDIDFYSHIYKPSDSKEDLLQRQKFLEYSVNLKNPDILVRTWLGGSSSAKQKNKRIKFYFNLSSKSVNKVGGKVQQDKNIKIVESKVGNLNDIYYGYLKESYHVYRKYMTQILKILNNFESSNDSDIVESYNTELSIVKKAEANLRLSRIMTKPHCNVDVMVKDLRSQLNQDYFNNNLRYVYDENGMKHHWNIYVYDNKSELTKSKIAKDVSQIKDHKIVDIRCSVCNMLYSEVDKIDTEKIKQSVNNISEINKLYNFYIYRCPESGNHVFKDTNCEKCGFSLTFNLKDKINYYNKYKNKYTTESTMKDTSSKFSLKYTTIAEIKDINWKYDHSIVLKLVNTYKLNINSLEYIGLSERKNYDDILSGNIEKPDELISIQLVALETYIRSIIIDYNTLKYAARHVNIPNNIQKLFDSIDFPLDLIVKLPKILPSITNEFHSKWNYIKTTVDNHSARLFLMEFLCRTIMTLKEFKFSGAVDSTQKEFKADNDPVTKLVVLFADTQLEKIINTEKYLCRKVTDFVDTEIADDFDEIVISDKKFNPFSFENFDYDGSNEEDAIPDIL
jgi:hypothetical protein